jgi:hypothetical protein
MIHKQIVQQRDLIDLSMTLYDRSRSLFIENEEHAPSQIKSAWQEYGLSNSFLEIVRIQPVVLSEYLVFRAVSSRLRALVALY